MWVWEGFYLEDPCELTFANTLLLSNAAISLGNVFINLEISSEYIIFFTLWSFFLSSLFISLQIKEFRILALSINDSLYSSLFFFLTGLHFFHLSIGLILLIYFWCSRSVVSLSAHALSIHVSPRSSARLRREWSEQSERNEPRKRRGMRKRDEGGKGMEVVNQRNPNGTFTHSLRSDRVSCHSPRREE